VTQDDFALIAAVFAATFLLSALLGARAGNARRDVALMGGSGAALGALSALLFAA
jgi:hypothetical protein